MTSRPSSINPNQGLTVDAISKPWMTCTLCSFVFNSPKQLPCKHTFCKACLEKYVTETPKDADNKFHCPACKALTPLPGTGASGFRINFFVEKIFDFMQPMHLKKKLEKCKKPSHKDSLKFFCVTDECPICDKCKKDHTDHKIVPIADAAKGYRKQYSGLKEELLCRSETMRNAWDETDEYQTNFTVAQKSTKQEILKRADALHKIVNMHRDCLIKDIESTFTMKEGELVDQKQDLELKMLSCAGITSFIHRLLEYGSDLEAVTFKKFLNEEGNFAKGASIPEIKQTQIGFVPTTLTEAEICHMFGTFSKVAVPQVKPARYVGLIKTKTDCDDKEPNLTGFEIQENGDFVVSDTENKAIKFFDKSGNLKREIRGECTPRDICVMKDGNLAIVDRSDKTVKIFTGDGQFVRSFENPNMSNPCGIAINKKGLIYITDKDNKCIFVHRDDGEPLDKQTIKEDENGAPIFMSPWYITINNDGNLVVSDLDAHMVKIIEPNGHILRKYGSMGSGDGQLKYPWGVTVDRYGYILVADYWNNRIHILTQDGRFKCFVVTSDICRPADVDITPEGYLAVAECNGDIRLFDYFYPWE